MNETREQTSVSSSARDPIDRWLDVFVRLLRVPKADAQRIRDELEDHLRARLDDLMLTGHAEPDAVRLAVAELGETAELARQFQTAAKPYRRLTMLAGSAVVSAGLITSAVLLSGQPIPTALQSSGANVLANEDAAQVETDPMQRIFKADLAVDPDTGGATLEALTDAFESLLNAPLTLHHRAILARFNFSVGVRPVELKGMTVERALESLSNGFGRPVDDPLVMYKIDGVYELGTVSFFDERDAVLIEYDVRKLLYPPSGGGIDPVNFQGTVTSLIEPKLWGERARIGMVSTTMLVHAHPRVHAKIADLFSRIETRYEQQRAEQNVQSTASLQGRLKLASTQIAQFRQSAARLEDQLAEARSERDAARADLFRLEANTQSADNTNGVELMIEMARAQDRIEEVGSHIDELNERLGRVRMNIPSLEAEVMAIEAQLQSPTGITD